MEMGFIRMRRVRGLDSWVGGWSQPGRGLDQERVQELPGHTWQPGMETGAESWAGAGENQGPHGDGGPDPEEQRRRTVGGVCHLGGADVMGRDERGGLGGGSQPWAREEQVPDGKAILSNHRGRAGGAAAVPQN